MGRYIRTVYKSFDKGSSSCLKASPHHSSEFWVRMTFGLRTLTVTDCCCYWRDTEGVGETRNGGRGAAGVGVQVISYSGLILLVLVPIQWTALTPWAVAGGVTHKCGLPCRRSSVTCVLVAVTWEEVVPAAEFWSNMISHKQASRCLPRNYPTAKEDFIDVIWKTEHLKSLVIHTLIQF